MTELQTLIEELWVYVSTDKYLLSHGYLARAADRQKLSDEMSRISCSIEDTNEAIAEIIEQNNS